ncbi:MAG: hypothetical protein DDT25_00483 [Chloroflexi bacterium]|nr:hypothetical protein [Chloroflexota bacterium]
MVEIFIVNQIGMGNHGNLESGVWSLESGVWNLESPSPGLLILDSRLSTIYSFFKFFLRFCCLIDSSLNFQWVGGKTTSQGVKGEVEIPFIQINIRIQNGERLRNRCSYQIWQTDEFRAVVNIFLQAIDRGN